MAIHDEVEPKPVHGGTAGDYGICFHVGDRPAVHEEEIVNGHKQQWEYMDLYVQMEWYPGFTIGDNEMGESELQPPVHERDDGVE